MEGAELKIVVTGGAGFIGSHVTKLLCDLGYDVHVIDNLSFGHERFIDKRAKYFKGDFSNEKILNKALKNTNIVIHLAASSIIKFSYSKPLEYTKNNVLNGITLLESMRKNDVNKIVFASSAAVYGNSSNPQIKEDDLKNPINLYGATKLAFENILSSYYYSYGLESTSLRLFNVYGPNDEQKPRTRAVPMWIEALLNDKKIEYYWKGKQIRDYIFVEDVAKAFGQALSRNGVNYYNVGSGQGIQMKNLITLIEKVADKKMKLIDKGRRKGDSKILVADISEIKKELGWKPTTEIENGIMQTYKYYLNNLKD